MSASGTGRQERHSAFNQWTLSPLDFHLHLVAPSDHAWGWELARCGHVMPPCPQYRSCNARARHPKCQICAQIADNPLTLVPYTPGAATRTGGSEGRPVAVLLTTALALSSAEGATRIGPRLEVISGPLPWWVRCPITAKLHRLDAEAVHQINTDGAGIAACGVLITREDLRARGFGDLCEVCVTSEDER